VRSDDLLDLRLVSDVRGDRVDVVAVGSKTGDRLVQLLRPPGGHRDGEPFFAEHPGDRQSNAAGGSRYDRCALCHLSSLRR